MHQYSLVDRRLVIIEVKFQDSQGSQSTETLETILGKKKKIAAI